MLLSKFPCIMLWGPTWLPPGQTLEGFDSRGSNRLMGFKRHHLSGLFQKLSSTQVLGESFVCLNILNRRRTMHFHT